MLDIGYKLSSEEHAPGDLLRFARRAEEAGFSIAWISDHYHPWTDREGQSPFTWSVLGGLAAVTERIQYATGVTCPTVRYHPALIAQAVATVAALMPGRFLFGVGTGEALNEHIYGDHCPTNDTRADMLEEALEIIRLLWQGEEVTYYGAYYTVENARLYTLPDPLPPIMIAAEGSKAAGLAGRLGDGLISTKPNPEVVQSFEQAGGQGKPRYAEMTVCWAQNEAQARRTAYEIWPIAGVKGELTQILPTPAHFEQVAKMVTQEDIAKEVVCGPHVQGYIEKLQKYADAGFTHVWLHQIGPDQEGFFKFWERELRPALGQVKTKEGGDARPAKRASELAEATVATPSKAPTSVA